MKKHLIILPVFLMTIPVKSQLLSLVLMGDTLKSFDQTTKTYTQLTKWIPTFQAGKILSSDGSSCIWINQLVAGTDYLAPNGNGSSLTGLTKSQVGLSNVDNTSDANKPVSTAVNTALGLKQTIPVSGQALGGTVTQATNKTTGVTINKQYGQITMNNAALAAAAEVSFVVTNSTVVSTDVIIVNVQSVGTAGSYFISVGAVSNGSFSITVGNASTGSLSQAIVLNFAVIKSVNN